jgi:hypothetical protein
MSADAKLIEDQLINLLLASRDTVSLYKLRLNMAEVVDLIPHDVSYIRYGPTPRDCEADPARSEAGDCRRFRRQQGYDSGSQTMCVIFRDWPKL